MKLEKIAIIGGGLLLLSQLFKKPDGLRGIVNDTGSFGAGAGSFGGGATQVIPRQISLDGGSGTANSGNSSGSTGSTFSRSPEYTKSMQDANERTNNILKSVPIGNNVKITPNTIYEYRPDGTLKAQYDITPRYASHVDVSRSPGGAGSVLAEQRARIAAARKK